MIVYRDLVTGDEVLSDAFPLKQAVDSDGKPVSLFEIFELENNF